MVMFVLDTNVLISASPTPRFELNTQAVQLIMSIVNGEHHCIAVDDEGKIIKREYNKHIKDKPLLISWLKKMYLKGKVKTRSGKGPQICNLQEMDNCFACVAMKTTHKLLVTEDSDFGLDVKQTLQRKGVSTIGINHCLQNYF